MQTVDAFVPDGIIFNGADYVPARDNTRLTDQLNRIVNLMQDGDWRTLRQISDEADAPEASVSAQLRHLRKPRFGGHQVAKRYLGNGLYEYRVIWHGSGVQS